MSTAIETQLLHTQPASPEKPPRLESIDLLRGAVIAIMAIDHVRDYISSSAGVFDPTDLSRTSAGLFLTRWITHFCAPIFVFLAGIGSYLATQRGRSGAEVSWFLLSRGAWLVLLEIFVITPFGWSFQADLSFVRLQVIWVIGISMILLSALNRLPASLVGGIGLAMIVSHNLLDGSTQTVWRLLHGISFHQLAPGHRVASLYPLIPWAGVLMAGFGAGQLWTWDARSRRIWLYRSAGVGLGLFVALRMANGYGDPSPWSGQASALFTVFSFLNVSKYPPSLDYLLLTLSMGAWALARLEAVRAGLGSALLIFGRVPLFFYLLHLPLIHGIAVVLSYWQYGDASWLLQDPFALRRGPHPAPAGYGYDLPVVYLVWVVVMAILYPLCRAYGKFKSRQRHPAWSYL